MTERSARNKIKTYYNQIQTNKDANDKLKRIVVTEKTTDFNNRKSEIILIDNQLISDSSWEQSYQFNDLNDTQLCYLIPFIIVRTLSAWKIREIASFNYQYWWNKSLGSHILTLHANLISGKYSSSNAPLYLTAKIQVLNPKIYSLITNPKT